MHQALYRKWRPQTFDDVCGQEHITDVLRYEVENSLVSHAYLFCGSRGTGKTSCAKILARAVNCEHPVHGSPCGECEACRSILNGTTTDIIEMDAASNNKVDDVRTILDEVIYTPSSEKYRVYIVDEVHMLSTSAFNALLKTLEEPPAHVIFILATTEMQKLPATIVSRCQRFDFHRISVGVLAERLRFIAKEENIALDEDAALIIARLAQGGMRDAISLFELCAAGGNRVTAQSVSDAVGFSGRGPMSAAVRAIAARDTDALFRMISEIHASARDLSVFWQELIGYYRDLLVVKTAGRENAAQYLDLTDSEADMTAADAKLFPKEVLSFHSRLLDEAYSSMQRPGVNRRTVAELTFVRLCDEKLSVSPDALLCRIEALEKKLAALSAGVPLPAAAAPRTDSASPAKDPAAPGDTSLKPAAPAVPDAPAGSAPGNSGAQPAAPAAAEPQAAANTAPGQLRRIRRWAEVTELLRKTNPGAASLLSSTCAAFTDGTGIVIRYKSDVARRLASAPESFGNLCSALSEILERPVADTDVVFEKGNDEDLKPETDALAGVLENLIS